jgi:hypothetical protein
MWVGGGCGGGCGLKGVAKAAVVSNGKDWPDDGNNNGGNNGDDSDNDDQAINLPNHAATTTAANNNDDEGVPRKTLVTTTIWKKTDAANADIPEGGASNRRMTKLRQYLNLTFESLAPPRSGCS